MIRAVIFDLDGVIVSTDEFHYQGWQRLADEEAVPFDRQVNERLRGVSRQQSLEILLERDSRRRSDGEKHALAERKNEYYRALIQTLVPGDLLPGVPAVIAGLKDRHIKIAIASSSKNTWTILERVGLTDTFDAVVTGNDIRETKPSPEIFLKAAHQVGLPPAECLVIEDAAVGVEGALRAGMRVLAVGSAATDPRATARADSLATFPASDILMIGEV
ncbi:MAG: beta-phosphoglucomutase [Verrucomicrobiales bacterium]|nr:beta-phosphoglucomutase [Verrucomicrobiales bacterium]